MEPATRRQLCVGVIFLLGCVGASAPATRTASSPESAPPAKEATEPSPARPTLRPGAYDLKQLPVFSKVLYYVRENYIDKARLRALLELLGSLEFVQRDVPEVMVEHWYDPKEPWVTVRANEQSRSFSVKSVNAPWILRRTLAEILAFVQDNLVPVSPEEEGRRALAIEMAATNGMLYALDPDSVLIGAEDYAAMRGRFPGSAGAVGLVIGSNADDEVVALRVPADSPAALAGIEAKDRIVRVGDEPTAHMNLQDVIDHLRGEVGTKVDVWVRRDGARAPRKLVAIRAPYAPGALSSPYRLLRPPAGDGGRASAPIGYLHLDHFAASAARDAGIALAELQAHKVGGVILDLRGNGGGLYEQAVKVADAFLKGGMIVSMVGPPGHKDEVATDDRTEPQVPVAVLVDRQSAAASEIVAAAIKELDRGIVIGEKTFGRGSIQVLFDIASPLARVAGAIGGDRPLGLKLTTAQWVSPSRRSVQNVGLAPDIELLPQRAARVEGRVELGLEPWVPRREGDYYWRPRALGAPADGHPQHVLPYLYAPPGGPWDVDDTPESRDAFDFADGGGRDFAVELARDLLARAPSPARTQLLASANAGVDLARAEEDRRLVASMKTLGIDWSHGAPSSEAGRVVLQLETIGPNPGLPGARFRIRAVAKNVGGRALHRVRGVLVAATPFLDGKELAFGAIEPGGTKSCEIAVNIPRSTPTLADVVTARLVAAERIEPGAAGELVVKVEGAPRPVFAFNFETADAPVETPRKGRIVVEVRNIGLGPSPSLFASLANAPGRPGVLIDAGLFRFKGVAPGQTVTCPFVYEVPEGRAAGEYAFDLSIGDSAFADSRTTHRISFEKGGRGGAVGQVTPPTVTASAPVVVTGSTVALDGTAASDGGLRDVFVSVQDLSHDLGSTHMPIKVFYLASPGRQARMSFQTNAPLQTGSNLIRVTARSAEGVPTTTSLIVLRTRR